MPGRRLSFLTASPWWAVARSAVRVVLPVSARRWIIQRAGLHSSAGEGLRPGQSGQTYEALYEAHARAVPGEEAVGAGDFDLIGRVELGVLLMEGLREDSTLVDFGCGIGRLAAHAVSWLQRGHYLGIDISPTMLDRARKLVHGGVPAPPSRVSWLRQTTDRFALRDSTVDMLCAFSVFTHMEPEDCYRCLRDARRIIRPGGRFLLSCLPMDLPGARQVFLSSASMTFEQRWRGVRCFTTSMEVMNHIADLAGWKLVRWYRGDEANIRLPDSPEMHALGQSTLVLSRT